MPLYKYKGRDKYGRVVSGVLDVASEQLVANTLNSKGVTLTEISLSTAFDEFKSKLQQKFLGRKPDLLEVAMVCRQMHTLIKAGVSLTNSFNVIAKSCSNKFLARSLTEVSIKVQAGNSLVKAVGSFPRIFSPLTIAILNVGEQSGKLAAAFAQVATYLEKDSATQKRIKAASRYPIFVVVAVLTAVLAINVLVIPSFSSFFAQFDAKLPWPTQTLLFSSYIILNYWYIAILLAIAIIIAFKWVATTKKGKVVLDTFKLKLPVIGSVYEKALLARFARAFIMTFSAGVPIVKAFGICAEAMENSFFADKIIRLQRGVSHGGSISATAMAEKLFPPLVLQIIAVGEASANVESLLEEVAIFYEGEVEYEVKRLGDSIEPILVAVVAILVLILALGVFLPMWDLAQVAFEL